MIGCDEERAYKLLKTYGSPLYVFDEQGFIDNYQQLLFQFRRIYPKYNIAYSYKTNYTPYICQLVKKMGGFAEVVSHMEFQLARKLGYECRHIIYNGPVKGEGLYEQLREGGVVNVDNLEELYRICAFARDHQNIQCKLAFRLNIDIGQPFISRFGIDAFNGDLDQAFCMAREHDNIQISGLHCHVGRSRGSEAWKNRVDVMFKLVDRYFANPPEFIDLGSGMNSVMEPELAKQFPGEIPTFEEYASLVATRFAEKYGNLPEKQQPLLLTEPGTTLISGFVSFLCTVDSIKTVRGKTFATFDASSGNMGEICLNKQLPLTVYPRGKNRILVENADFAGYTCLEHDIIYRNYTGMLGAGDVVQFRNLGSYSSVFKPPFIAPNCSMVAIKPDGTSYEIKRKETFEDIFETYTF